MTQPKTANERRQDFDNRMREQGFYRIGVWIPKTQEAKEELTAKAEKLRNKHLKK